MKRISLFASLLFLAGIQFMMFSCKKESDFITDSSAKIQFSTSQVVFDTVFTTLGSTTKRLMVYNSNSQKIKISSIALASGTASPYRLNVDGIAGTQFSDIEIEAHDSMFIFVKVTVDPNNVNLPMLVSDSIIFLTNGNTQDVDLLAWGQDAHFIIGTPHSPNLPNYQIVAHEGENITWHNDKPYVIYGYAVIDSTAQLNIDPGVRIYLHSNAGMWVYKGGCIKVNGALDQPVTFQGDRLEQYYKDVPGQWDRIWLNEGTLDNEINYAVIKNAFIGIQAEILQTGMGNKLQLNNTIIQNSSGIDLLARNYKITATNCLMGNSGSYNVALTMGGIYDFRQCTFGNYYSGGVRQTPALYMNNYYKDNYGTITPYNLTMAYFGNCIVYGNNQDELGFDQVNGAQMNFKFDYCGIKTSLNTNDVTKYISCIINADPAFILPGENNYQLTINSPMRDNGSPAILVPTDLLGKPRNVPPDRGCYQFIPAK
ncbi:MAG: hypothetical protein WCH34_14740 [Bacteroidota bacterium]